MVKLSKIVGLIYLKHYQNCILDEYIIMPDHFHGIVIIQNSVDKSHGLSEIVRGFKTFSSRKINILLKEKNIELPFKWQKSFFDHVIRNEKSLYEIRKYISQNPSKFEFDRFENIS